MTDICDDNRAGYVGSRSLYTDMVDTCNWSKGLEAVML